MTANPIQDRGRGPEIAGTRITVYNLLPDLLDPTATEDYICRVYQLTPEQVASARAYILNNPETVLTEHLRLESKMAAGNPPQVIEGAKQTHAAFLNFKKWLAEHQQKQDPNVPNTEKCSAGMPTFREWISQQSIKGQ